MKLIWPVTALEKRRAQFAKPANSDFVYLRGTLRLLRRRRGRRWCYYPEDFSSTDSKLIEHHGKLEPSLDIFPYSFISHL